MSIYALKIYNFIGMNDDELLNIIRGYIYQINDKLKISYKPLSENATTPSKSAKGSAALDTFASSDATIVPNDRQASKQMFQLQFHLDIMAVLSPEAA